jgi:hypothetical protein
VGDVGRADHHLAAADDQGVIAEAEAGLTRFDHKHLCIWVLMNLWAGTGRRVHEDDREGHVPVLGADELVGMLRARKVVEVHDQRHRSLLLPPEQRARVPTEHAPAGWVAQRARPDHVSS